MRQCCTFDNHEINILLKKILQGEKLKVGKTTNTHTQKRPRETAKELVQSLLYT